MDRWTCEKVLKRSLISKALGLVPLKKVSNFILIDKLREMMRQ